MKLSSDKEHLVLDNQRLVHYLVQKLGVAPNSSDYEDIVSIGTIGLVKAAITFDTSKNITFATYASRCINNEIFMHYRKANKYANDISIDEPIGDDGEGKELTLVDTIADPDSNFVEKIVDKEEFIKVVGTVLNCLEGKHRIALLYLMADVSQREIAEKLNISQSYVSRIEAKATQKVQKIKNQQVHYKEVFSMGIVGDEYKISFSSKEISKFNKIFATLLQNLTSVEKLPDFKVNCNRERIIIQIPAHPESFAFIAQIIQEIDDFSMSFVSNRTMVQADDTDIQSVETADTNVVNETEVIKTVAVTSITDTDTECISQKVLDTDTIVESGKEVSGVQISEQIIPTLTGTDKVDETNSDSTVQKGSQVKQVREYMLSMDSFTVKDLKLHFPNFTATTINNALYLAKSKGLITAISRGKYAVNKT